MATRLDKLKELMVLAMLAPLLTAVKFALSGLYNIELVSLLLMVFTYKFGYKALLPALIFSVTEVFIYGINIWNMMYLYVWAILVAVCLPLRKIRKGWVFALTSGLYGLLFGCLCAVSFLFVPSLGLSFAVSWAMAGFFPADILHCVGNFFSALLLYIPLTNAMDRIIK